MQGQINIQELQVGDQIEGFYLLKDPQLKTAASGKPFLRMGLADRTGSVDSKVWDYSGPISAGDNGAVAFIQGSVSALRACCCLRST